MLSTQHEPDELHHPLHAWQEAMALVRTVYEVTLRFPVKETYVSSAQLRRAAVSIPSNCAEGGW